ncbi:MAG: hypothetical protein P4L73_19085 [Caulobacteraceae bacterium]|nr:hypothetical protein [Caulobacteraceae bacterium]
MAEADIDGRAYARLDDLQPGDTLIPDGGFDCLAEGQPRRVWRRESGELCIDCRSGVHVLAGQDDGDGFLVGLYRADPA